MQNTRRVAGADDSPFWTVAAVTVPSPVNVPSAPMVTVPDAETPPLLRTVSLAVPKSPTFRLPLSVHVEPEPSTTTAALAPAFLPRTAFGAAGFAARRQIEVSDSSRTDGQISAGSKCRTRAIHRNDPCGSAQSRQVSAGDAYVTTVGDCDVCFRRRLQTVENAHVKYAGICP